jgi:hypothetical protein
MLLEIFTSDLQKFLIAIGLTRRLMGRRRVAEAIPLIDRGCNVFWFRFVIQCAGTSEIERFD